MPVFVSQMFRASAQFIACARGLLGVCLLWVLWGLSPQALAAMPFNEALCPASHQEPGVLSNNSPACFQQCKPDHVGVSGLCVQARCPTGSTDLGAACAEVITKDAYTRSGVYAKCAANQMQVKNACFYFKRRCVWGVCVNEPTGVGMAKTCAANQVNQAGVCYTPCKSGYQGTGPICHQQCPAGFANLGTTCQKSLRVKQTYVRSFTLERGVGSTDSFVRSPSVQATDDVFTVAVMSDPQLPWDDTSAEAKAKGGTGKIDPNLVWTNSRRYNLEMVQSINKLSDESNQTASKFAFTVINGDLTAYFHPDQHTEFRAIYDRGFPWAYPMALKTPVYLGLGNHDYQNNLSDCNSFSTDNNRCAKNAINLIRGSVFLDYVKNMPSDTLESYDAGSLAYSWNKGPYHFVQLHNEPDYEIPKLGISKSVDWLEKDLARATQRGQTIIVNMHKPPAADSSLARILGAHSVAAIFAGHLHSSSGKFSNLKTTTGQLVPVFLSGSADEHSFLRVDFQNSNGQRSMRIAKINTTGGNAIEQAPVTVLRIP
jgi:hypothetical protein